MFYLWSYAIFNATKADANEYNKAVIGHIIQTKVSGGSVDTSVLEASKCISWHTTCN